MAILFPIAIGTKESRSDKISYKAKPIPTPLKNSQSKLQNPK